MSADEFDFDDEFVQKERLYLLYNKLTGYYKIGISESPKDRAKVIKFHSGCEIDVLAILQFENIDLSARQHEKFLLRYFKSKDKRVIGEWCNLTTRDLVFIRNYVKGISYDFIGLGDVCLYVSDKLIENLENNFDCENIETLQIKYG